MTLPEQIPRHRFTVEEFHRMAEAGILGEDDRVELIQGELIEMTPIGSAHARTVAWIAQHLALAAGDGAVVWTQNPIRLDAHCEPQPDVALLRARADGYWSALPGPGDVLLVVEVADSSLAYDRDVKAPLYAAHGVPELWLVDLQARHVIRHRRPSAGGYTRIDPPVADRLLVPERLPAAGIDVGALFR